MGWGQPWRALDVEGRLSSEQPQLPKAPALGESREMPAHLSGTGLSGSHSVGELHALKSRVPLRKL